MVGEYIGLRKIKATEDYDDSAILVTFEDGTHKIISKLLINSIVSSESLDESTLQNNRIVKITEATLELFKQYNVEVSDVEHIFMTVKLSLENNVALANEILWGVERKTMLDIDRVLKSKKVTLDEVLDTNK